MRQGGDYQTEAAQVMRFMGLLVAPVLGVYAALTVLGILPTVSAVSYVAVITVAVVWATVGIIYSIRRTKPGDDGLRLVVYHALSIVFLLLVSGYSQPVIMLYVLLLLGSYFFYGKVALALSVAALLGSATLFIVSNAAQDVGVIHSTILSVALVLFLGTALIILLAAQETKRQVLAQSRERERLQYDRVLTIMNNLTDASFSTNDQGKILLYNAACLDLLDTNVSLKGRNVGDLFNLTDTQNNKVDIIDVLKSADRATRRDDLNHTYEDGESIRLEITFAPIRSSYSLRKKSDEQGGYIIIMRDVTKQKSLEEERDEFISVVSHELRTPITIVEGSLSNLDVMMKQPKAPDQTLLSKTVTTAHEQVLYLAKMVNDLSTLSRAERGVADTPESIDVTDLLTTMFHQYEKEAEKHNLKLNLDLGTKLGTVNTSRLYLEELLQNFITNAIKYTKEGNVTITARTSKGTVRFTVSDTGIGISKGDQTKIFNKFYRSEDYRTRETSGTGLGLYVSAKLAHKLHTRIELTSRLNHGSSFSFELPVE